jgi:hypothetical protein
MPTLRQAPACDASWTRLSDLGGPWYERKGRLVLTLPAWLCPNCRDSGNVPPPGGTLDTSEKLRPVEKVRHGSGLRSLEFRKVLHNNALNGLRGAPIDHGVHRTGEWRHSSLGVRRCQWGCDQELVAVIDTGAPEWRPLLDRKVEVDIL